MLRLRLASAPVANFTGSKRPLNRDTTYAAGPSERLSFSVNISSVKQAIEAAVVTMSITNDEAKNEVEEKLRKQQLTKPMTEMEMAVFCQAMLRNLELKSESALSDIRGWSENWQSK